MAQAAVGVGVGLDGREAADQAVQQALNRLESGRPIAALVFASQEFNLSSVLGGLGGMLRNIPTWGFSTYRVLTEEGETPRSVCVVLLAGTDLKARSIWIPGFSNSTESASRLMEYVISDPQFSQGVLVAADGLEGDAADLCASTSKAFLPIQILGGTASTSDYKGKTYQLAANQTGSGGMAVLLLGGNFRVGIGLTHGWRDLGLVFNLNQVKDRVIYQMDGKKPHEVYENLFGFPTREWYVPPLTNLARLFPFGIEDYPGSADLILRSPLAIDETGNLHLGTCVENGCQAHMMIGDREGCIAAARQAAEDALLGLGKNRPIFGLLLVDLAWHYLFEGHAENYLGGVQDILKGVPIAGAYTLGQIASRMPGMESRLYNQHFELILVGEGE